MKVITKIFAIMLISMIALQANAQGLILKGGLTMSNMKAKDDHHTYSDDFKMKLGFHLGAGYEMPINDMLYFEPSVLFTTKGYTVDVEGSDDNESVNLFYVDIPMLLKAKFEAGDAMNIYGAIGPYLGMGISGKNKYGDESEDIDWGSDDDSDLRALDYGLSIGAGLDFGQFVAGASYDMGLANITPNQDEGSLKISNNLIKVTLGYRLGY